MDGVGLYLADKASMVVWGFLIFGVENWFVSGGDPTVLFFFEGGRLWETSY